MIINNQFHEKKSSARVQRFILVKFICKNKKGSTADSAYNSVGKDNSTRVDEGRKS